MIEVEAPKTRKEALTLTNVYRNLAGSAQRDQIIIDAIMAERDDASRKALIMSYAAKGVRFFNDQGLLTNEDIEDEIADWRDKAEEEKKLVTDFNNGYCNDVIAEIDKELRERKEAADKAAAARLEEMNAAETAGAAAAVDGAKFAER